MAEEKNQEKQKDERAKVSIEENKDEAEQSPETVSDEVVSEEVEREEIEEEEALEEAKPGEPKIEEFRVGDTVKINYKIIEGDKTRIQPYSGIVISKKGSGISKTFTVRKISANGVGVERIFPLFSPNIERLKVVRKGRARRSKLYYLRERIGKQATRIREQK